jgi:Na+/H+ antiporter NhaD/arsenite permease-like protein
MDESIPKFNFFTMFKDGVKSMTVGKTLWIIVIIKLIIMFLILRPFFFPNFLNSKFDNNQSKADYVSEELVNRPPAANE